MIAALAERNRSDFAQGSMSGVGNLNRLSFRRTFAVLVIMLGALLSYHISENDSTRDDDEMFEFTAVERAREHEHRLERNLKRGIPQTSTSTCIA
jgi:hypothetical protein